MKVGTKSLLFGVHQFIYHPIAVLIAWIKLYGSWPNPKEIVCIIIHDWGYWGKPNMDGPEGESHPEVGAKIARCLFGPVYGDMVLLHSRHYARQLQRDPSKLCWADKLGASYYPMWLYLFLAHNSGEQAEYRKMAVNVGFSLENSDQEWFKWMVARLALLAKEKKADAVPYINSYKKSS
jgi:hypothetical protein